MALIEIDGKHRFKSIVIFYGELLNNVWNNGIRWYVWNNKETSQLTNSIIFQRGYIKPPTSIPKLTILMAGIETIHVAGWD